jgi:hypothetical protein
MPSSDLSNLSKLELIRLAQQLREELKLAMEMLESLAGLLPPKVIIE